ncbi:metallophosphoesterase family protein [Paenibacillus mendelii]|uniref:Metallophosphoesterase family protein n=1 Tax=Paenibacillus mendelii TaxID=206163 RepID=A0ABV6JAY0_9BACL|nr:metallophosphoesterase [Paenibacillus mendelii]MCQ6562946.1 metallophosphoesterase [Paenibacillus mendelii]
MRDLTEETSVFVETIIGIPGLKRELKLLHVTDSHFAEADNRDEERIVADAERFRQVYGGRAMEYFQQAIRHSNEWKADCTIFTGDIVQFPSFRNMELMEEQFGQLTSPYLYTLGNHDWLFTHHHPNDELRSSFYPLFNCVTGGNPSYGMIELEGVKLIILDDSNYQVNDAQLQFVRDQLAEGIPTLLFFHIPLYVPTLADKTLEVWRDPIMVNAPGWDPAARDRWGLREADASTQQFHQMLTEGEYPNAAAIFCGHLHFPHRDAFAEGRYQYVTKAGFEGGFRKITLKPL